MAIGRCLEAGFAEQAKAQKRTQCFKVPEVIGEFGFLGRKLASLVGDTRTARPIHAVPDNPARKKSRQPKPDSPSYPIAEKPSGVSERRLHRAGGRTAPGKDPSAGMRRTAIWPKPYVQFSAKSWS